MIEVPIRVKDALRSGDYRKNYKINVQLVDSSYERAGSLTITRVGSSSTFEGVYDFPDFGYDEIKLRYPESSAFGTVTIYKVGYPEILIVSATSFTETYCEFGYNKNLDGATITIKNVNFVPAGTDTATLEIWKKRLEITIDNNNLVAESVKFDERMCSNTDLKFGLCEGTSVEFQYFDLPNINGQHINIELYVEYKNEQGALDWFPIPMGQYDVNECSRQASTGIIKVSAYNKLQSKYLEQDVSKELIDLLDSTPSHSLPICEALKDLMSGYAIEKEVYYETLWANLFTIVGYNYWGIPYGTYDNQRAYSGYRMAVEELEIKIEPAAGFDVYSIYRFIINTLKPVLRTLYNELVARSEEFFDDWVVWADDENVTTYLSDYVNADFDYSKHFGGYFKIIRNGRTSEYKLYGSNKSFDSGLLSGVTEFHLCLPIKIEGMILPPDLRDLDIAHNLEANLQLNSLLTPEDLQYMQEIGMPIVRAISANGIYTVYHQISESTADSISIEESVIQAMNGSITLRDMQSAVFELNCQYGKLDRVTDLFAGIELNDASLYPRDDLYPANDLLPMGTAEAGYPAMYSKLWADEGNVRTFRYLIITYKAIENGEEVEKTLQRTVNTNGTDNYNMSDNWLFRNLVWTAEQVGTYADAMVEKMRNISWFPFEMWCAGLPYLEAGDVIEIAMKDGAYPSPILRRTLNGIQNLHDEMINGTLDIF